MAGRNTKLTPETQKKICDKLRDGNTRRVAALLGGISEATFYNWLERARPESEDHDPIYLEFLEAVTRAEAEAEEFMVSIVRRDAEYHPKGNGFQAALQWLNRRQPKDWSEKQQVQQTTVNIDLSELNDEELDRVLDGEDPEQVYKDSRTRREREAQEGA